MEKIKEIELRRGYLKLYNTESCLNVFDVIKRLKSNGCEISTIEVRENVERDMQTVDGMEFDEKEFGEQYHYVVTHMREGSFHISCVMGEIRFKVIVYDCEKTIGLSCENLDLEIGDIF